MRFEYSPYILPLIISTFVSGGVAIYAWTRRRAPGAAPLAILAVMVAEWSLGYALEIAGSDLPTKLLWGKLQYIGITTVPLFWLIFAFSLASQGKRLDYRRIAALAIIPAMTLLLAFTTEMHGAVWKEYHVSDNGSFSVLKPSYGVWFAVHVLYSYLLLVSGTIIILRSIGKRQGLYRGQTVVLVIGVLVPLVGNLIYVLGRSPLDLTPFGFVLSAVAVSWGIYGFRLIDLSPLARDMVLEEMQDGLIVIDAQNRIADLNPTAQRLIGQTASQAIGKAAREVFAPWPHLIEQFGNRIEALEEIALEEGEQKSWYELRLSPLHDQRKRLVGRAIMIRDITDRKRTDERIRQLSRAVEASPASIVITDTQGKIEYANPKFTQLTGYTFQEALGQNPRILKSGQTPPEVYRQLWETIAAGGEWRGEFCNLKKNGEPYWELASISPIANEAGKITHYIAIKEDITEQRRVREQIRQQNEYLSVLHQMTLELLNRREAEDLLQAIIERACVLLDAPYGELMLKSGDYLEVRAFTKNQPYLVGDRADRNTARLSWQAHDTRQPVILEDYSAWPGRREIYAENPLHAVADFPVIAGDECIGVLAVGRSKPKQPFTPEQVRTGVLFAELVALVLDNANLYASALREIEERKRTEILLQDSEARFRQIVETAGDAIYRADVLGRFTYVNPTVLRLLGLSQDSEALGKYFYEVVAPGWRDRVRRFYYRQFSRREKSTYFEFPAYRADGHEFWLGQNVQIIEDGEQVIGFQAVARDITALKRAQEALALARDQALEASRLKSQLLSKVSHELRTPLGGILGYAELLHSQAFGALDEAQTQAAAQIVDSANYLASMVNELLDQAQIEARTMLLRSERFSPAAMLQKVEAGMSVLAHNKGLAFTTAISPDLPPELWGDERRLVQILINLIGNAIKFTKTGQVSIQLALTDPTHWTMQVADTGIGVPAEARAFIFEPFRQVDNALTRENRGTGLGLSIAKQLVELMGGRINLQSELGKGSTFTVWLPLMLKPEKIA